jgi:hypothetical protein
MLDHFAKDFLVHIKKTNLLQNVFQANQTRRVLVFFLCKLLNCYRLKELCIKKLHERASFSVVIIIILLPMYHLWQFATFWGHFEWHVPHLFLPPLMTIYKNHLHHLLFHHLVMALVLLHAHHVANHKWKSIC